MTLRAQSGESPVASALTPGYWELRPPDAVAGVVACLWIRVCDRPAQGRIVPDGSADLVWLRGSGTTVVGPDTAAKLVDVITGDVLVGMRLRPGAGGGVLGIPLNELRDQRVSVAEIDRAFDLDGEMAPDEVLAGFRAVVAGRRGDPLVLAAARQLGHSRSGSLAGAIGLSERHLLRRFRTAVGYGPKTLERVLRFSRFVDAVDRGRSDIARLALDLGYADQAHLTRETTRLAGMPPVALLKARGAATPV